MAYLLAAMAAFVNAVTAVLQRIGVETAPESTTLRLSLISYAVRRRVWLIGFGLMLVVFGLQATALRFGELSVVQPVLTTELLFLLLILGGWFRFRLTWQEWLGALATVGGLGGFFLAARPSGGQAIPTGGQWVVATVVLFAVIAGFIAAALRGPRWWRAAAFGAAAAVTGGYSAALTKAITNYTKQGWGHVFTHFQPYMLAVVGLGVVFLLQNALHAGPITASRTTLVTISPLVGIVLGRSLFADRLRSGAGWIALEAMALVVLVVGIVLLARSPLVAGEHQPGDPGEMLGTARRAAQEDDAVAVLASDQAATVPTLPSSDAGPAT